MVCYLDAKLENLYTKLDRLESKLERKLDTLPTRRFAVWLAVISTAVNIMVISSAVIFSAAHGR